MNVNVKQHVTALIGLLLVHTQPCAMAGEPELTAGATAGGGGTSSGGGFTLRGAIAPAAGGVQTGGPFTLTGGLIGGILVVELPDPDAKFETWMANLPPSQLPPPDERGPLDTPARDGVSNLLKYALGLPPMEPAANAAPRPVERNGYLAVEFRRAQGRGVAWTLLHSIDLKAWNDVPFDVELLDTLDGIEHVIFVSNRPAGGPSSEFLRLRLDPL